MILTVQGPTYFSQNDETAMFEWLARIKVVRKVTGAGRNLQIDLNRAPTDAQLRDILGLFFRYKMDLATLAVLLTEKNRNWFANREAVWFEAVFR